MQEHAPRQPVSGLHESASAEAPRCLAIRSIDFFGAYVIGRGIQHNHIMLSALGNSCVDIGVVVRQRLLPLPMHCVANMQASLPSRTRLHHALPQEPCRNRSFVPASRCERRCDRSSCPHRAQDWRHRQACSAASVAAPAVTSTAHWLVCIGIFVFCTCASFFCLAWALLAWVRPSLEALPLLSRGGLHTRLQMLAIPPSLTGTCLGVRSSLAPSPTAVERRRQSF